MLSPSRASRCRRHGVIGGLDGFRVISTHLRVMKASARPGQPPFHGAGNIFLGVQPALARRCRGKPRVLVNQLIIDAGDALLLILRRGVSATAAISSSQMVVPLSVATAMRSAPMPETTRRAKRTEGRWPHKWKAISSEVLTGKRGKQAWWRRPLSGADAPPESASSVADDRQHFNPWRRRRDALPRRLCHLVTSGGLIDNAALPHYVETGRNVRSGGAVARLRKAVMITRSDGSAGSEFMRGSVCLGLWRKASSGRATTIQ